MQLDRIDLGILEFLQNDAKMSANDIGAELGLTTTPIYERIKKLEREGIIDSYRAILSPPSLERGLLVYMSVTLKEHGTKYRTAFVEHVLTLAPVMEFVHTSGSFDFFIKARFRDIPDYRDFLVNKISTIENIGDIESYIVLEELKLTSKISLDHLN